MPFFSVVVPTYNAGNKLKATINSVLNQTCKDFEILVMDDGSTDETKKVIESFADSRIIYDWKPNSGGPATPRNRGIEVSSAPWISFLDADDLWHPRKLELVKEVISEKGKYKLEVICHNELLNLNGKKDKKILEYGPYTKDFYYNLLTRGNCLSTSAVTVRKDFLTSNNIQFNQQKDHVIIEDYDLWLYLAHKKAVFYFINEVLGEYVIEGHNISHDTKRSRHNNEAVLKNHVFNVQTFESNKEKLWSYINTRLLLEEILKDFSFKFFLRNINKVSNLFLYHPFITTKIILVKLISRIQSI